ncbi:MAG: hypothetical protein ACKOUU_02815 [Acinetobacter tjernbergiae]
MMEHFSIKAILSVTTLITTLTLVGCNHPLQENGYSEQTTEFEQSTLTATNNNADIENITLQDPQDLSSGNMLNIARDIAKLQLETDDYAALLKQSQNSLEQAIQNKNTHQLQHAAGDLKQELHGLHDTLLSLNLKSHEVDQIRQSLLSANQQLLTMPLLHGQTDLSKLDFNKIEKQFNTIQMDMVKIASLVLDNSANSAA